MSTHVTRNKISEIVRYQTVLPDVPPREQIHWMVDRPDAELFVEAQDPVVLLRIMEQAGWEEASALIPYVSAWQLQVFLDFDAWQKDRFQTEKLVRWFEAALELTDDSKFKSFCRETDSEILAMLFQEQLIVGVFDEDQQPPPEFDAYDWVTSPDGVYALVYPEDEEMAGLVKRMLYRLYEVDRVLAWTLLEAARWELHSNMEEEAYRWRNSRLEEFGFVSREEALEIYKPLDPVRFRDTQFNALAEKNLDRIGKTTLPALFNPGAAGNFYILQILNTMEDEVVELLLNELISVQNRALLADGIEPSNASIAREITERTLGYMSLGLEFLARGKDEMAEEWLKRSPIRDIFRVGFSLIWKMRKTALELTKRPTLSIVDGQPYSLLGEDDQLLMEGLSRSRPVFMWNGGHSIFTQQSQVDDVAGRLALIAFKQLWAFGIERMSPSSLIANMHTLENSALDLTFDLLFATKLSNTILQRSPAMKPFDAGSLAALVIQLQARPWEEDPISYFSDFLAPLIDALGPSAVRTSSRWLQTTLTRLDDELAGLREISPLLHTNVLLIEKH
jgi:hypothetical protein